MPTVQWNARSYFELINWDKEIITEPPLTFDFGLEMIRWVGNDVNNVLDIPKIPCHSQANERAVATTTKVAAKYTDTYEDTRTGTILRINENRQKYPTNVNKSAYK